MLAAWAPPLRMTWRPAVVVRVDTIWKLPTALAVLWAIVVALVIAAYVNRQHRPRTD